MDEYVQKLEEYTRTLEKTVRLQRRVIELQDEQNNLLKEKLRQQSYLKGEHK